MGGEGRRTATNAGKVVQLNDIPAGSLDHYWADVAVVVATEAAGGVNDVINRQSGREPWRGRFMDRRRRRW